MLWVAIGILLKILVVVSIALGTVAYLIYVERKVAAYAQDRVGPNRAGKELGIPFGLLQPLADGAKMVLKEDVIPGYVSRPLYMLAPVIAIVAAMIGFAVVPFGPVGPNQIMDFQIAPNINIGILYVFAIGSLAVYGIILAGWASNNKYAFIGALRSSAQLISYEIPLAMSILGMVLIARSLDLNQIVNWQDSNVWGEYLHLITVSYLTVILFFGGWDLPFVLDQNQTGFLSAVFKVFVLLFKVALMILFIMWVRWTLPRFRYDHLMDLAWKSLIPLALVNLVATAAIVQLIYSAR